MKFGIQEELLLSFLDTIIRVIEGKHLMKEKIYGQGPFMQIMSHTIFLPFLQLLSEIIMSCQTISQDIFLNFEKRHFFQYSFNNCSSLQHLYITSMDIDI